MIFDYTNYLKFDACYGEGFKTLNRELIDVLNKKCPYCNSELKQEYFMVRNDKGLSGRGEIVQYETIYYCENDGWWQHKVNEESTSNPKAWYSIIHEGILKKYREDSKTIPIDVLSDYIYKNPEKIVDIHERKMEELVASVFSDFYNCEAKVVGKSSDGGVDVVYIEGDIPTMVQVKRRKSLNKTESVSYVRELLGATLLKDSKSCIYVTTANKFSKKAEETASRAIEKGIVERFDLVNYSRFIDMLKSNPQKIKNVWEEVKTLEKLEKSEHYGLGFIG
ncbi:restriction system protein [Lachnospiraceae bacterium PF1-21]